MGPLLPVLRWWCPNSQFDYVCHHNKATTQWQTIRIKTSSSTDWSWVQLASVFNFSWCDRKGSIFLAETQGFLFVGEIQGGSGRSHMESFMESASFYSEMHFVLHQEICCAACWSHMAVILCPLSLARPCRRPGNQKRICRITFTPLTTNPLLYSVHLRT